MVSRKVLYRCRRFHKINAWAVGVNCWLARDSAWAAPFRQFYIEQHALVQPEVKVVPLSLSLQPSHPASTVLRKLGPCCLMCRCSVFLDAACGFCPACLRKTAIKKVANDSWVIEMLTAGVGWHCGMIFRLSPPTFYHARFHLSKWLNHPGYSFARCWLRSNFKSQTSSAVSWGSAELLTIVTIICKIMWNMMPFTCTKYQEIESCSRLVAYMDSYPKNPTLIRV